MSGDHFSLETLPENEIVELLDQEVISTFIFLNQNIFSYLLTALIWRQLENKSAIYSESYIYRIRLHPLIKHLN